MGATQCPLLSLKKRMKPGTEWERPADKTAKHYGNGGAELLICTHTHTCWYTHKTKCQSSKFARPHVIMRRCIWLARGQNNSLDPQHLWGGPHQGEPADYTSKQTTVHQVCWSVSDWLSSARNRVRCTSKPPLIGWARPKKLRVGKSCFHWLPPPHSAGEWVSKRMALRQLVQLGVCEETY